MAMPKGAIVRVKSGDGRFTGIAGLTERQSAFVRYFVSTGGDAIEAARLAGYGTPDCRAAELARHAGVQRAIAEMMGPKLNRMALMASDLMMRKLEEATADRSGETEIPLKELRGILGMALDRLLPPPKADNDPSVSKGERTVEDLEAELARARLARADAARMIEGEAEPTSPHPSVPSMDA